jgi:hypothetical protein
MFMPCLYSYKPREIERPLSHYPSEGHRTLLLVLPALTLLRTKCMEKMRRPFKCWKAYADTENKDTKCVVVTKMQ